jgi:hypothetical protein
MKGAVKKERLWVKKEKKSKCEGVKKESLKESLTSLWREGNREPKNDGGFTGSVHTTPEQGPYLLVYTYIWI